MLTKLFSRTDAIVLKQTPAEYCLNEAPKWRIRDAQNRVCAMIKPSKFSVFTGLGILIAGTAAVSAAQIALGNDQQPSLSSVAAFAQQTSNRSAKSDRLFTTKAASQGTAMSFQVSTLANTLIVARIPVAAAKRANPSVGFTSNSRSTVACEPPVSTLTNIAKFIGSSRCVT
jgi:hypothetical protein